MGGVVAYAERARTANCIAVHRLAQVFANLLEALAASPDQLNASTLHTIEQTIEFLATLSNDPAPDRFKDPSQARGLCRGRRRGQLPVRPTGDGGADDQTTGSEDPSAALLELASEKLRSHFSR